MVSLLGILPVGILFLEGGWGYLIPLIVYNNFMDDLDGIVAEKLNIKSSFGAALDNTCDCVMHTVLALWVGFHYGPITGAASVAAVCAILLRVTSRVSPNAATNAGSPTNELIRHVFFILILAELFSFRPDSILITAFCLHAVSMLVPYPMPYLLRSLSKSALAVILINVLLLAAWLAPVAAPIIGGGFILTYVYSFIAGGIKWVRR